MTRYDLSVDDDSEETGEAITRALRLLSANHGGKATYGAELQRILMEALESTPVERDVLARLTRLIHAQVLLARALTLFVAAGGDDVDELSDDELNNRVQAVMTALENVLRVDRRRKDGAQESGPAGH